jgi:hypothetical protein
MGKYDDIKKEIESLLEQGHNLYHEVYESYIIKKQCKFLLDNYESWYTKSLYLVRQLASEREKDFIACYKSNKRRELNPNTYVISDMIQGVGVASWYMKVAYLIRNQVSVLRSCYDKFDSKVFDLETLLRADVFDSEIESARHLLKNGFLRRQVQYVVLY